MRPPFFALLEEDLWGIAENCGVALADRGLD